MLGPPPPENRFHFWPHDSLLHRSVDILTCNTCALPNDIAPYQPILDRRVRIVYRAIDIIVIPTFSLKPKTFRSDRYCGSKITVIISSR
jgi:hypothetical protein